MEISVDVSNNFSYLSTSEPDSSMFFCQPKQEEFQLDDQNSCQHHEQIHMINNPKRAKPTVSFPFGKW